MKKKIIIIPCGTEMVALKTEEIAIIQKMDNVVHVIDGQGNKYITSKPLSVFEEELDQHVFFRANRQVIFNVDYLKSFYTYKKANISLQFRVAGLPEIIVSQQTATRFREWIRQ